MRKQHFSLTIGISILITLCCFQLNAQEKQQQLPKYYNEEFIVHAKQLYDWNAFEKAFISKTGADFSETKDFFTYLYKNKFLSLNTYLDKVNSGTIDQSNATQYWLDQLPLFEKLYKQEKAKFNAQQKAISKPLPAPTAVSCNNLDFTDRTTNWTGRWNNTNTNHYGDAANSLPTNGLNSSAGTNGKNFVHEMVTGGQDPHVPIQRVPGGHTSALRLGSDEAYGLTTLNILPFNHQMIRNTFTVSSANPTITYWYAVVFTQEKGTGSNSHNPGEQPYFKIRMYDKNGAEIKCASYDVDVTNGLSGGFKQQDLPDLANQIAVYKDWVPVLIPLIDYVNQQVTIQFESSDCIVGGHIGYAYVAVDCGPFQAITSSPFVCGSNTIKLTAPDGSVDYEWSGPGVIPPLNQQSVDVNKPGTYSVTMSVVGNSGVKCTYHLDTVIKGTLVLPVANFTSDLVCVGKETTFTDTSTPKDSITEWLWDFDGDGIIDSKLQNPKHKFSTAGTFDVKLTVKQGPCDSTITKKVTVAPLPVLKITNPAEVCLPTKVDITAANVTTGSTGGGTLTYWTDSAATTVLANPTTIGTSGTYYIKTTTAAGCTDIKPVVVKINPGADLKITDPLAVCYPGTVDITAAAVTTGSVGVGTLSYWSDPAGMVSVGNPTAISVSGTYYIKATPATGCTDIKPVKVVISPLPTLTITTPSPVCTPGKVDLTDPAITAGSSSGGTYSYWKDAAATIILPSPNAVGATGTYYIKIVVAGGCSNIQPVNVTINPLPISYAGPDVVICTGDNAMLGTNTVTPNYSYSWSPATGLSNANISNPTVSLTNFGKTAVSYNYVVTTTNTTTKCVTTDTVKVTVNIVPTVNAGTAESVCSGMDVKLKGTIGGSASSATWSGGAGKFANKYDLETTYSPTEAEFMAGTVTLTLTSDDPEGPCTFASSDVIITFYQNPTVKFSADKKEGCPVHCVKFSDSSLVIGTTDFIEKWNWSFGDPNSGSNASDLKNPSHCYENTGYYDVALTVTSNHGCKSTQTMEKMIHVFAVPVAEFTPTPNPVSVLDPTVTLVNGSSPDVVSWVYHFGDGDSIAPSVASPVHLYPDKASSSYLATLTVKNADGCVNYVEHIVEVGPEFTFYIPNAFTPDGDGINDYFSGKGIGIVKYDFVIFDRWGNLIFHSESLEDQWNGRANNGDEISQQDVFVWKVKLTDIFGKKHSYMGTVTLVK